MAISVGEKRLIGAGGLLLVLLFLYLLPRGVPTPAPAPFQPNLSTAPPPAPASPPPQAAAPAPDVSGLRLHGLLASGAILGFADGSQRLVPVGREALPGLVLQRIEQNRAVLAWAGGELSLGFDGAAQAQAAPNAPLVPAAAASEAALREESLRYRLGLAPRRAGGRVAGFTVRPGASLPALERAGIRPGDTIVSVNGSGFDEERMTELAWQMANSSRTIFEVERGGRRLRLTLEGR